MHKKLTLAVSIAMALSGCQSIFGPVALQNTHPAYNQAIIQSLNEQMLLNLVRLKYRDKPYFLKVSSVTAALSFGGNIGIGSEANLGSGSSLLTPSLGIAYADEPTISFQPLHGEDFLKSVLSSISFDALLMMTQSGWSIERVFGLCVERINDLHNAPSASGPSPVKQPEFKNFKRAMKLFRELQLAHEMEIGADKDNHLNILFKVTDNNRTTLQALSNLLGIEGPKNDSNFSIILDHNFLENHPNQLKVRPRSIASVLFYLSQHIDVPQHHKDAGLVTITQNQQGTAFDWTKTPVGELFHIHYSEDYPERAFLTVPYRDHWFYIADNDLESKTTFMLLTQLFELQAGQTHYSGPTLTLPVR